MSITEATTQTADASSVKINELILISILFSLLLLMLKKNHIHFSRKLCHL